ncbi:MAG TPA: DUF6448 family protein [Prolixibacteraceae bacterium]
MLHKKKSIYHFVIVFLLMCSSNFSFAHCDTKDGPVVADARKAIEENNVNYVLKWVQPVDEKEIKEVYELIMKVRMLSPEAKELSNNYFFETLVRVHRSGEGVSYTGVKPSGTPIDEKIFAADKSIALGNLSPLNDLVPKDNLPELKKRFDKVLSLKNFDVNNVQAGREYIEAYVQFFHYAEGEEEGHNQGHIEEGGHWGHISWILSGIFFITSVLFGALYYRKK